MRHPRFSLFLFLFILIGCAPALFAQTAGSSGSKTYKDLSGEDFITKDGVKLIVSYYPGNKEKDTIPVILLHDWKGDRRSLHSLAVFLQKNGCAVLVPDLRGHGESLNQLDKRGRDVKLNIPLRTAAPSKGLMTDIVAKDIEQCKRFLITQNDNGKLNIQKLCVVGVGPMGCALALAYTSMDWSWDPSQGRDVKAVALVTPESNYGGLIMKNLILPAMSDSLSVMILFGSDDSTAKKDAQQLYKIFEKNRGGEAKLSPAERSLFAIGIPTTLQGAKLLGNPDLPIEKRIAKFIELRVQTVEIFWKQRRN